MKISVLLLLFYPLFSFAQVFMPEKEVCAKHIREIRKYVYQPYSAHILSYGDDKPFLSVVEQFDTLGRLSYKEERNLSYFSSLEPAMSEQRSYLAYGANGKVKAQVDTIWYWGSKPDYYVQVAYTYTTYYQYDAAGHKTEEKILSALGKERYVEHSTYNTEGNLLLLTRVENGILAHKEEYTYDAQQRLISKTTSKKANNGKSYSVEVTLYTYDEKDHQLKEVVTQYSDGSVISKQVYLRNALGGIYKVEYYSSPYMDNPLVLDYDYEHRTDSLGNPYKKFNYRFILHDTIEVEVQWEGMDSLDTKYFDYTAYDRSTHSRILEGPLFFNSGTAQGSLTKYLQQRYDSVFVTRRYDRNDNLTWKSKGDEEGEAVYAYEFYATPIYPDEYFLHEADTLWYDGKVRRISTLKKGNGKLFYYNEEGSLIREESFQRDKLHGVVRQWYANGKLSGQAQFANDVHNGEVLYWDSLGTLRLRANMQGWNYFDAQYHYDSTGKVTQETYISLKNLLIAGNPFLTRPTKATLYGPDGKVTAIYSNELLVDDKEDLRHLKNDEIKTQKQLTQFRKWVKEAGGWYF